MLHVHLLGRGGGVIVVPCAVWKSVEKEARGDP